MPEPSFLWRSRSTTKVRSSALQKETHTHATVGVQILLSANACDNTSFTGCGLFRGLVRLPRDLKKITTPQSVARMRESVSPRSLSARSLVCVSVGGGGGPIKFRNKPNDASCLLL
jgi:hypothetical protein